MIFVTVGAQMSFDRMVRAVDRWAGNSGRGDVFAQIGPTDWKPTHIQWTNFIQPPEFRNRVRQADVVIAHAGMGSIITALELGKPIIVMPRRGELRETRNDHQLATAKQFLAQGRIIVAFDENHLIEKLDQLADFRATERISPKASPRLLAAIRSFVLTGALPAAPAPAVGLRGLAESDLPAMENSAEPGSA